MAFFPLYSILVAIEYFSGNIGHRCCHSVSREIERDRTNDRTACLLCQQKSLTSSNTQTQCTNVKNPTKDRTQNISPNTTQHNVPPAHCELGCSYAWLSVCDCVHDSEFLPNHLHSQYSAIQAFSSRKIILRAGCQRIKVSL